MNAARLFSLLIALAAAACSQGAAPPREQWKVVLQTDAPVPQFGDRLLVQVLNEDGQLACEACERLLPAGQPQSWPISFGVVESAEAMFLQARLYRGVDTSPDGLPSSDIGIAILGKLPPLQGVTEARVTLSMDCFGEPVDFETKRSCSPGSGENERGLVFDAGVGDKTVVPGSWSLARETPCEGEVPDGMVCVPGGLFLLGSPTFPHFGAELSTQPERLVRLSPFALDIDEMTVGRVRQLLESGTVLRGGITTAGLRCAFSDSADSDPMPANCLSFEQAQALCADQGKRLPTEAEWEFAAGNRVLESEFSWGAGSEDICARAVVSRGEDPTSDYTECRSNSRQEIVPAGPVAGGLPGDVTSLGLRNMVGNLREWVSDRFAPYTDDCWSQPSEPLTDPRCDTGPGERTVRGNDWLSPISTSQVYLRNEAYASGSDSVGVRCAFPPR